MANPDEELDTLLNDFETGKIPLLLFLKRLDAFKREYGLQHSERLGKAVIGSFGCHTEGRDLMAGLLEANGFRTVVAGRDTSIEDVIAMCRDPEVTVLCLSVQTTYDCPEVLEASRLLEEEGIRDRIVLNIGGSPITKELSDRAGGDVFSTTASGSARKVREEVLRRTSD